MKVKKFLCAGLIFSMLLPNMTVFAQGRDKSERVEKVPETEEAQEFKTKDFIIKYKDNKVQKKASRANKNKKIHSEEVLDTNLKKINNTHKVKFYQELTLAEAKKSVDLNEIEYIQPDYEFCLESIDEIDNNVTMKETSIEAVTLASVKSNNNEVIVAVIDSKMDLNNTKLKNNLWVNEAENKNGKDSDNNGYVDDINGYSFVQFENELNEFQKAQEENHATHIAGIISGNSDADDIGVNTNIKIMPVTVFKNGTAKTSDIISAIEYARDNGAKIINASFGSSDENPALKAAIESCPDILFVCAAGNNHRNLDEKPVYPACYDLDNVISVTSINEDKGLSYYSNYGEKNVHIAARGKNISSTVTDNKTGIKSGTSMAAALVSRAAGLFILNNSKEAVKEIKEAIINGADKLSTLDGYVGFAAGLNINDTINNKNKDKIENIDAEDEFSLSSETLSEGEQMQLFSQVKTIDISCGDNFALALKEDGTVWAWGTGTSGQLGNGLYKNSTIPVQVKGIGSIVEIKAGGSHALARDSSGNLYSWGSNTYGQLGSGSSNRSLPDLACQYTITESRRIAAGSNHTMIAWGGDSIAACGCNTSGQLGIGAPSTGKNSWTAVQDFTYRDAHDVKFIEARGNNSFAYTTEYFLYGQIGTEGRYQREVDAWGSIVGSSKPKALLGIADIYRKDISVGYTHAFFINNPNDIRGIGDNLCGQLGIDPIELEGIESFRKLNIINDINDIVCGFEYTLALRNNGEVYCWGVDILDKEAASSDEYVYTPRRLNISGIKKISSGMNFSAMLDNNGDVWTIGSGIALGNGSNSYSTEPVKVAYVETSELSGIKVEKMDIGESHSIAIKDDGTVWTWGNNTYGQLGNGTNINSVIPVQVTGITNVTDVSAGGDFSLALTREGKVYAWGKNDKGQLGNGTSDNSNVPIEVSIAYPAKAISAGYDHSMLVTRDVQEDGSDKKQAWTWGCNDKGQLGNGTYSNKNIPVQVPLTFVDTVSAGYKHSMMKKQDNSLFTWGNNTYGQLGDNRSSSLNCNPKNLSIAVNEISAGTNVSMIKLSDGTVKVCGYNLNGELGLGNTNSQRLFVQVPGLTKISSIGAGNKNMYAVGDYGAKFYIWGDKTYTSGILTTPLSSNQEISMLTYGSYSRVKACNNSQLILMGDGSLHSFGANEYGQLGNGGYSDQDSIKEIVWLDNPSLYPENGAGSASNPYLIYNEEDFNKIANKLSAHYKLSADIDFKNKNISPIGSERNPFTGGFDGGEFSFSGFNINLAQKDNIGLFGYTNGANIKNVKIYSSNITGNNNVGALIGYMNGGSVDNCAAYMVNVTAANGQKGLIGYTISYENITNVYFDSNNWAVNEVQLNAGNVNAGEIKEYLLTTENVPLKKAIKFKITYDWNNFDVVGLGFDKNKSNGTVMTDNNITIEKASGGELIFIINEDYKNWSGVLVPIEFKAKTAGNLTFKFGIQGV